MIDIQKDIFDATIESSKSIIELQRAYRGTLEIGNLRQAPISKINLIKIIEYLKTRQE